MDPIEVANEKSLDEFVKNYMPPGKEWTFWTHPKTSEKYNVSITTASALSGADFNACFNLVHTTSLADYKASRDGWHPRSKRKEMRLLDLKYLLVKRGAEIEGFASLMPTYEDDYPVIYCYEIHLSSDLQGTGLGSILMGILEEVGAKIPGTRKTMLTCFTSNARGVKFYEKLGYVKDEFSPPPRKLRNGTLIEVDYLVLSKSMPSRSASSS